MEMLPMSAVVPTRNRTAAFHSTLTSLVEQGLFPAQLIVVDASDDGTTRDMVNGFGVDSSMAGSIQWIPAQVAGAAAQRNQGVATATQPFVWFFDDDIRFEQDCLGRMWRAINSDNLLGGVNAMIVNQKYLPPGAVSRLLFRVLSGTPAASYAGRVIGPAVSLLPEDREDMSEVVPVEWLNTTCTMYRRDALPSPPFDSVFTGYSMMEDLTLSLRVKMNWKLANARTARVFHDSQPGPHKADVSAMAAMELVNRHYVMTRILGRRRIVDYLRLVTWEIFQLYVCAARSESRQYAWRKMRGQWSGINQIKKNRP